MDILTIAAITVVGYVAFQSNQQFIGIILFLTAAIMASGKPAAVARMEGTNTSNSKSPLVINQPIGYAEGSNYQFRPNWSGQDQAWYMTEQMANAVFMPFRVLRYIIDQITSNI